MDAVLQALFGTSLAEASWWLLAALLAIGFALLAWGSDWLVDGSARLATRAGVSRLVVGLTVVAWGTSAPEVVVSAMASARGQAAGSLGNVLGSNIANIGLVLGSCGLVLPKVLEVRVAPREIGWLFVTLLALWWCASDRDVSRADAAVLLALFAAHTAQLFFAPRGAVQSVEEFETRHPIVHVTLGTVAVALGAYFVLEAGQTGALRFGVSELVVGLAVLAVGTSLPELAAGLRSALHGHDDISLGNVVGSNVFNVSAAIGIAALVRPLSAEAAAPGAADALDAAFAEALRFDFPAVVALSIVLVAVTYTPRSGRAKGVFLLALYAAYWGLRAAL